ncbi:MAG: bifunctional methylenetetrahydrofolate dehydrogenase/methenyltetrahydrofolate cyclohydrolase FolD [Burkholderiales bacterium]
MTAKTIDGKSHAAALLESLRKTAAGLAVQPGAAVVLVGDDPASRVYTRNKARACSDAGVHSTLHELPGTTGEAELCALIDRLNADPAVHGIIVQLPLPAGINAERVLRRISPHKDIDGFHPENVGALALGSHRFVPCTPAGILRMLEAEGIALEGRDAVVVGRSNIVGKPMALLLLEKHATVTICHSKTVDLAAHTRRADVLVAAVGRPRMITADMVKPGACVIDVGIHRMPDGKLAGDVDFASVRQTAGWITPVPGGVGPMTVAMLVANTVRAAEPNAKG